MRMQSALRRTICAQCCAAHIRDLSLSACRARRAGQRVNVDAADSKGTTALMNCAEAEGQSGVAITSSSGTVLLNLGAGANTFLNGVSCPALESTGDAIIAGNLLVTGTNVMDAIPAGSGGGSTIDSSTDLQVNTLTTASDVSVGGTLTGNAIRSNSGGWQGRARIENISANNTGADFYSGINNTAQYSIFNSPQSKFEIWALVYRQIKALDIVHSGYVTFYCGTSAASDKIVKDDIQDMPEIDAIDLLKSVSAKTYTRKDMTDNKKRGGFIAQDFEIAPTTLGENLVGTATHSIERGGVESEIKTLAYDRIGSPILWTVCRNLLSRIKALETKLKSNLNIYRWGSKNKQET